MKTFYMIRWRQRQSEKPYGFFGDVTGAARFDDLEEVARNCWKVNARWQGQLEQWPVQYELTTVDGKAKIDEVAELRGLVGLSEPAQGSRGTAQRPAKSLQGTLVGVDGS